MAKKDEKDYWFKAKRYGYGWGMPLTWQGWVVFTVFIAVWLNALAWLLMPYIETGASTGSLALFLIIVFVDILGLLYFSFKYGEPPKLRLGLSFAKRGKKHASKKS